MASTLNPNLLLAVPLAPLAGAVLAGLAGRQIGRRGAHIVCVLGVAIAFVLSLQTLLAVLDGAHFNATVYEWMKVGGLKMEVGFLVDGLTAMMMVVVTFVSLMVHIYTIGYMADDPGYQRFFAYISLFTFSMLMLVMSNNFLQLFFGWEAVGLVSYLLIGFWYTKPTAIFANLKAFLVNRVGDFGFILGIGLVVAFTGSLDYAEVFGKGGELAKLAFPGTEWMLITVICICLFVGAMGKSAQFPLHVWLPDSMEGPTPISALIHAATMVTAGIFMVARMSPLFELSETARSVVLVIGAITTLFMALIALTQYDIKRVVAYSTLSQLGYMTTALGASAYAAGMFHLMTHAFFKALLFLGAGSVIIALHHEQDMRHMGGLRRRMPITYWTFLLAAISSVGIPGFAGYYSKDAIIEAVHEATLPGHLFAYLCTLLCVFVTATYTFRMLFMAFHGKEHFHGEHPPHESPLVVTLPLMLLAIPSVGAGWVADAVLSGEYFGSSIVQKESEYPGLGAYTLHGFLGAPFWLGIAGIVTAWFLYIKRPGTAKRIAMELGPAYAIVERKYGFDELYAWLFAGGARNLGRGFWRGGDQTIIDGVMVNGSARVVGWFSGVIRLIQTGLVNQYAVAMLFGVLILTFWFLQR
jgi:NADH-quinone oxidoreductase subunit L